MMYLVLLLVSISFFFLSFYRSKRNLHMLQQNLYNENNRYLKWTFRNSSQFLSLDLVVIFLSIITTLLIRIDKESAIYPSFNTVAACGSLFVIFIIYLLLASNLKARMLNDQNKKPLVVTSRVKRLIFTTSVIYLVPIIMIILGNNFYLIVISVLLWLNPFVVFVANIINYPYERCVYYHFKRMAQSKLKSMQNLKIIGITGSYGKTSSKNILSDILNVKYNALPTPRNLNTYNGLIMTVNNHMDKFTDIFIAEMGAYVKGEIRGLCNLVHPKYGILTTIGTAHLESFGSEENIIQGKFELIESLPSDGFAVLNGDDPKQVNYNLKNKVKTIWIGIDNQEADVRATNIKCSNKGTTFDVVFKGGNDSYTFTTKLLGNHNVYNILAGIACGIEFGIDIEDLIHAVSGVRPVEHRLELKKLGNFYQIDDAYNSNPVGAKNACQVLGMMPGVKVVVTPGMIELGEKEDEYNKEFGRQIAEVADYAVLIGAKKTKPIYDGLLDKGFDKDKIVVLNDVRDAYPFVSSLVKRQEVYALFENDLPDTYNE